MKYEITIGLETHVQLATVSKAFCGDSATFGGAPNTHVSAISLAHPGTLPKINKKAVEYAVRLGLALGCEISRFTAFDRKNYFYADLPKGFQTTQDKYPICIGGQVSITLPDKSSRTVQLHHIHLEEDAGKSMHDQDPFDSLIDLNRAGVPLLEIVSEPDMHNADEVVAYMESLRHLVRWLDISDGNMEEGSLRCDVNISVRPIGADQLGKRCEVKNINSMRFARKAIEFEATRQIALLEKGRKVVQETRGFDPATGQTYSLRDKEDAHDYRYFPEPDLPPMVLTESYINKVKSALPTLPHVLLEKFQRVYGLPAYDADLLTQERSTADFFERLIAANTALAKLASNLIINKLLPWTSDSGHDLNSCPVSTTQWLEYLTLINSGKVSASAAAQRLFPALLESPSGNPTALATTLGLLQNADADFLAQLADEVLARFPDKVKEYQNGKKGLIGFFMGEVMKAAKGSADPQATTKLLQEKLMVVARE